jgi:hypothetical protein
MLRLTGDIGNAFDGIEYLRPFGAGRQDTPTARMA